MIGIKELQGFYLKLDESFKCMILAEAKRKLETWKDIAKRLDITDSGMRSIRNPKELKTGWIKGRYLVRLSKITGFSLEDIGKNVLAFRKQRGHACVARLPIEHSPSLAELVGYSLGDGHVGRSPPTFVYVSKNISVIYRVKSLVKGTFGISACCLYSNERWYAAHFPYIVGELLLKFGSVDGNKTGKEFLLPSWIMNGRKEIKRSFLLAIFEDEGTIHIHPENKGIVLAMAKRKGLSYSLKLFLNQIRQLLMEFDIASCKSSAGTYIDKQEVEKIMFQITIHGKRNVVKFKEEINFLSKEKKKKLNALLKSYRRDSWGVGGLDNAVCQLISREPLTSARVSEKLKSNMGTIRYSIKRLEKKGLIRQGGKNGRFLVWTKA